jgi:hypothetical protein
MQGTVQTEPKALETKAPEMVEHRLPGREA